MCDDYARMVMTEVKTPPFTKERKHIDKIEVDWSRELSSVRIHVERVIGLLKNKYAIFKKVVPITLLSTEDDGAESVDKLVRVCCCLVNMCPSIVAQDWSQHRFSGRTVRLYTPKTP